MKALLVLLQVSVSFEETNVEDPASASAVEEDICDVNRKALSLMSRSTTKHTSVPSEDSDQPGHPLSLIRIFNVRME